MRAFLGHSIGIAPSLSRAAAVRECDQPFDRTCPSINSFKAASRSQIRPRVIDSLRRHERDVAIVPFILGGPNWLELDRFDVIAKVGSCGEAETQKAMLQALLEDRFELIARKETKPVPTWVLAAGKQPRLRPIALQTAASGRPLCGC